MTDNKILSEEEVSALTAEDPNEGSEAPQISVIDFAHQERIVRSEFPVLVRIHERMGRKLQESIYHLFARETVIETKDVKVQSFGDFIKGFHMPTSITVYRFHPLRSKALLIFDSDSVSNLVDCYFGGTGSYHATIEDREFTSTEQRVVRIVAEKLFSDLTDAWTPVLKAQCEVLSSEMNPQMVNALASTDMIIISEFVMTFDEISSKFYIVMPYTMLEPIREDLEVGSTRTEDEVDPNWIQSLQAEMLDANLSLNSILVETELALSDIINMKAGDIIPVELPEVVTLNVENIPTFQAKFGLSRDKCALKIIKKIRGEGVNNG